MGKVNQQLLAFNRGLISKFGLARIDVAKVNLSAEIQTNWTPRLLGSMMLRVGTKYLGSTKDNNKAVFIPFIFSKTQTAKIEFTNNFIRFWDENDELITRPAVTTAITNGNFTSDLANWTDNDEAGTVSEWYSGKMKLVGNGINYARRSQLVSIGSGNEGTLHAVRIVIDRGPVLFKIGSGVNNDDYFKESILETGTHSLAFIPNGNFYVNFYSPLQREVLVESIEIESAGVMSLPSPYSEDDLPLIRQDQSLDIVYLAGGGVQQRELQRRDNDSWSIVLYQAENGPVGIQNTSQISITPSALSGNIILTANQNLFNADQVGAIFKLVSVGQTVGLSINAENVFTDYIVVEGVGTTRAFTINISGTWVATITLQRSFDEGVSWDAVNTYTSNTTTTFNDGLDNQIVWYRIGIETSDYTSGTAVVLLSYSLGSITGYVRITEYSSSTVALAEVLKNLGSTNPTTQWSEGQWSDYKGWPSAVALAEGRLFFAGLGKIWGSVSDAYKNFDDEVEGDSGTISRDLGGGAISNANWLISLYRLFIGCDSAVKAVKTTSFEEPMTPTNFRIIEPSTQACYNVPPAKLDKKAIFVQGAGTRIFELAYDQSTIDYGVDELTKAVPEIGEPSIIRIGIQRQPDTMIHCVRSDGKVAILIYDILENLKGWFLHETDGEIEDVITFPGDIEDYVYYSVKRTVNGSIVRYFEKLAFQRDCQGDILNKQADSFIEYSGAATNTITGLNHLEGEEVIVWADGKDLSPNNSEGVQTTYTVTSGAITLTEEIENAVVGLPYQALYKSSKLAYASGSPLGQKKKINAIGVIIDNTHSHGLQYSGDNVIYDNLPIRSPQTGAPIPYDTILTEDTPMVSFGQAWDTDSRLYLKAQAPRPCTLLACEIAITTNDKQ